MRALSTNRGRPSVLGIFWRCALRAPGNGNATAVLADALVLHVAADQREQRVVAADAHAGARHDLGPALPDDDRAGVDKLATIDLDTEHLRVRVAAVPRRAAAFLVCQLLGLLLRCAPSSRRLLGSLFRLLGRNGLFGSRLGLGRRFLLGSRLAPPSLPGGLGFLLLLLLSFQTDTADGDDLEGRQVGPPAVMHPHALFGLVADALGARAATVRDHLRVHVDAVDGGISNFDLIAVATTIVSTSTANGVTPRVYRPLARATPRQRMKIANPTTSPATPNVMAKKRRRPPASSDDGVMKSVVKSPQ